MQDLSFNIIVGLIGIGLIILLVFPKLREKIIPNSDTRLELEQRYAKEIADGTAVIIPKDPQAMKKFLLLWTSVFLLVVLFDLGLDYYIHEVDNTCKGIQLWSYIFIELGKPLTFMSLIMMVTFYKNYKQLIEDGYTPSRQRGLFEVRFEDRIAFKLTNTLKIREQLELFKSFIPCILLIIAQTGMVFFFLNMSLNKTTSIYTLFENLQESCLDSKSFKQ